MPGLGTSISQNLRKNIFWDVPRQEPFSQSFELFKQKERFCWEFGPHIDGSEAELMKKCIIFTVFDEKIGI